jgi:large subunit ribosomal protein L25
VEFTGESQAVKSGNLLMQITDELEVEALPANLPESIMVDISVLNEVDDMITAGDIKLEDKVSMVTQADQVIVKIEAPKVEEEAPVEEAAPGEVPAMNQKSEEEKAEKKKDKKK